ncbi:MAG: aryl-sulfate sulfotransferase, partial [Bacteroidota bacterium]|nr:aryl-sulfate sulfotransferase [Bacteroidota bacterium]
YRLLRHQKGLVYGIHFGGSRSAGYGYANISSEVREDNLEEVVTLIAHELSAFIKDGPTPEEFDVAKNLIFEWRSRDHFSYADPTHENFAQPFLDLTHCNSLELDNDSTFLLSSRSLDEVTKIDRETGNIVWRWGGKHNEFTFVDDPLIFSHQHAVRRLLNGNIIMFDNGNFHNTAMPFSRAVEYKLDEKAKTATQVWEYHHDPEVFGNAMGYVQRLKSGNSFICWGSCDSVAVTEVKPDGSTALEIRFDPGIYTYRAFKYTKNDIAGMREGVDATSPSPSLQLQQNYPNPFKGSSTINFTIGVRSPISLEVFNALGVKVKTLFNGIVDAGSYSAKFDAAQLPNGIYFYEITDGTTALTRMMILSK